MDNNKLPLINEILHKIMKEKGYRHNYEVAKYFNISAQTLSGWIKQKKIPPKHLLKFYNDFDIENSTETNDSDSNKKNIDPDILDFNQNEKISIKHTLSLFSKNKKTLLLFPLSISIITIFYLFFIAKPVYKTSAVILPTEGSGQEMNSLLGTAAQFGMSMPLSMDSKIAWDEIYPEIVSSERLKRIILDDFFSTKRYGPKKTLKHIIANELDITNQSSNQQLDEISKKLDELIIVNKTRFSSIVKIDIFGFEPEFTSAFAKRIIYHSGRLQREYKTSQINQKREFLSERIQEIEGEVINAESTLRQFREKNRHYSNSPTLMLEEDRLSQELVLQRSLMVTLKSQFEKAKIEEVEKSAMIQVIDEPFIPWKHDSPKRFTITIIFSFLSFFISIIYIYAKENIFEME